MTRSANVTATPHESRERWVERTFTVWLDEGTYGSTPDTEEIAYLLRMGGINADTKERNTK